MPISFSSNQPLATPMNVFKDLSRKHKHWVCIIWYGCFLFSVLFLASWMLVNDTSPARTSVLWKRFSECFSVNTSVSSPGSSLFFLASVSGLSSLSISSGDWGTKQKTEHCLQTGSTKSAQSLPVMGSHEAVAPRTDSTIPTNTTHGKLFGHRKLC